MTTPEPGFYYHYKHDPAGEPYNYMYEVAGTARNSEDKTLSVLYRPVYANDWMSPADYQSRPLAMFMETIEKDGVKVRRFTKITDAELIRKLKEKVHELYP